MIGGTSGNSSITERSVRTTAGRTRAARGPDKQSRDESRVTTTGSEDMFSGEKDVIHQRESVLLLGRRLCERLGGTADSVASDVHSPQRHTHTRTSSFPRTSTSRTEPSSRRRHHQRRDKRIIAFPTPRTRAAVQVRTSD